MSEARELPPLLEFPDRTALREWLARNHATSRGARIALGHKGTTATALTYEDAVEEALAFGWIDTKANRLDAERFTGIFVPRRPKSVWSRSNKERVERLAAAGLMTPAGYAAIEVAKANGSWNALDDVDRLVVPPDLAAALDADPGARANWDAASASQRRMALFSIVSAKRPDTRARRIARVIAAAKAGTRLV